MSTKRSLVENVHYWTTWTEIKSIRNIPRSNFWVCKIFWIGFTLATLGAFIWQSIDIMNQYYEMTVYNALLSGTDVSSSNSTSKRKKRSVDLNAEMRTEIEHVREKRQATVATTCSPSDSTCTPCVLSISLTTTPVPTTTMYKTTTLDDHDSTTTLLTKISTTDEPTTTIKLSTSTPSTTTTRISTSYIASTISSTTTPTSTMKTSTPSTPLTSPTTTSTTPTTTQKPTTPTSNKPTTTNAQTSTTPVLSSSAATTTMLTTTHRPTTTPKLSSTVKTSFPNTSPKSTTQIQTSTKSTTTTNTPTTTSKTTTAYSSTKPTTLKTSTKSASSSPTEKSTSSSSTSASISTPKSSSINLTTKLASPTTKLSTKSTSMGKTLSTNNDNGSNTTTFSGTTTQITSTSSTENPDLMSSKSTVETTKTTSTNLSYETTTISNELNASSRKTTTSYISTNSGSTVDSSNRGGSTINNGLGNSTLNSERIFSSTIDPWPLSTTSNYLGNTSEDPSKKSTTIDSILSTTIYPCKISITLYSTSDGNGFGLSDTTVSGDENGEGSDKGDRLTTISDENGNPCKISICDSTVDPKQFSTTQYLSTVKSTTDWWTLFLTTQSNGDNSSSGSGSGDGSGDELGLNSGGNSGSTPGDNDNSSNGSGSGGEDNEHDNGFGSSSGDNDGNGSSSNGPNGNETHFSTTITNIGGESDEWSTTTINGNRSNGNHQQTTTNPLGNENGFGNRFSTDPLTNRASTTNPNGNGGGISKSTTNNGSNGSGKSTMGLNNGTELGSGFGGKATTTTFNPNANKTTLSNQIPTTPPVIQQVTTIYQIPLQKVNKTYTPEVINNLIDQYDLCRNCSRITMESQVLERMQSVLMGLDPSVAQELGYKLKDIVISCSYNGVPCNYETDFTLTTDPDYGNCYTYSYQGTSIIERLGRLSGLRMIAFTNVSEYLPTSSKAGIRVTISKQQFAVFPDTDGYNIGIGTYNTMAVQYKKIERLSKPYGDCHPAVIDNSTIYVGDYYSTEACFRTCFQEQMVNACGCADGRFPLLPWQNVSYCSPSNNMDQFLCYNNYILTQGDFDRVNSCMCTTGCNEPAYVVVVSSATWPANVTNYTTSSCIDYYPGTDIDCYTAYSGNAAYIDVSYDVLFYQSMTESPLMTPWDVFYSISGACCLWISVSMIALLEFVELFSYLFTSNGILPPKTQKIRLSTGLSTVSPKDVNFSPYSPDALGGDFAPPLATMSPNSYALAMSYLDASPADSYIRQRGAASTASLVSPKFVSD